MTEDWARPLVAFEIRGRDSKRLQDFYRQLFNWEIAVDAIGIARVGAGVGGPEPGPVGVMLQGEPAGVTLYIQVLDLKASMEKAKVMGGSVQSEPIQVPNGPTIARIADPEGTVIGLVQQ